MKLTYTLLSLLFLFSLGITAQESQGPVETGMLQGPTFVPSLASQLQDGSFVVAEDDSKKMGQPRLTHGQNIVPGKGLPAAGEYDPLVELQQNAIQQRNQPPLLTFETTTSTATPSDPTGAVGPNHYVAAWNTSFRIFDKSGNPLTPAASLATLFPGNAIGDPIVFYDAQADRFVITEFDNSPNGFNVAVCQGSDPVNDGWHIYTTGFSTGQFPDYTKFSVWADTYMVTANIGQTNRVFAIERLEMLNGNPSQFVALPLPGMINPIGGFYSPQAFHNTDGNLAPAGTPAPIVYMQDDSYSGVSVDHLKVWSATIDWVNTANSSMSAAEVLNTTPYLSVFDGGSFSNLDQPSGPDIDAIQATVMQVAQYRRFGTHNSCVFNFVVDTDPTAGELAGIRWFELRQTADGQPWSIHQEGTYVSPVAGKHAWNGSMVMNSAGDIALGYTGMISASLPVGSYYTGRFASDPLGVMTVAEELIGQGTGNSSSLRYADYSQLTLDPVDETYWYVNEYFNSNRRNIVGQFQLAPPLPNDIGALSIDAPVDGILTATEDVTITIRNFGSNDITNPEVQYTIDGGTPVVENYSGTITAGTNEQYTFATQADLSAPGSYVIEAKTNLAADSNTGNDTATKTVTNGTVYCMPSGDCAGFNDGVTMLQLANQDIAVECGAGGYADNTSIVFDFDLSNNPFQGVVQMGFADSAFAIWIDFNDDGIFAADELIADEFVAAADTDFPFSVNFQNVTTVATGMHRMRVRGEDLDQDGDYLNPCDDLEFGRTNDYTANITGSLGIDEVELADADLQIVTKPNNQFDVSLITSFDKTASIWVINALGQTVSFNNISKEGDRYNYSLDMSYAAAGVYIVKMGDARGKAFKSAKLVVN
ncbi:MAG: T9SS type A sorting domain-containing protein [Flavobacteriaceae bacterium]|nr:T9SS type A sorting domain-containing protein [Flavobacteriaceae bacterium]